MILILVFKVFCQSKILGIFFSKTDCSPNQTKAALLYAVDYFTIFFIFLFYVFTSFNGAFLVPKCDVLKVKINFA